MREGQRRGGQRRGGGRREMKERDEREKGEGCTRMTTEKPKRTKNIAAGTLQ